MSSTKWFYSQRAYPSGIPRNAYLKAQLQLQQLQFQSDPLGSSWVSAGPSPIGNCVYGTGSLCSGRVTAIALDPTHPGTMYIGGAQGGVWKTVDGGSSWTPLTDNQPSLAIGSIAIDPSGVVYVGTGEGNNSCDSYYGAGVLKSIDGGNTWVQLGASIFGMSTVSRLLVNPISPNVLIASATQGHYTAGTDAFCNQVAGPLGVYVSTDGGVSWARTLSATFEASDIVLDPTNPSTVYAAADGGVYVSTNTGVTWTGPLGGGLPTASAFNRINLAISASSHLTLFASISINANGIGELFRTQDAGSTWSLISTPIGPFGGSFCSYQCSYDMFVSIDPTDPNTVYLGGENVYRTTDGGATWTDIGGYSGFVHPDQHAFAFGPTSHTTIYLGNDGGIWYSANGNTCSPSSCWTNLNMGLQLTQFQFIAAHPTDDYIYFGGTQDNGSPLRAGAGSPVWTMSAGGDGGWAAFDRQNPLTMYHTFSGITPQRSDDGGSTWHQITNGINLTDNHLFYIPMAMDPTTSSTMYLGTFRLYKTTNRGDNWLLPTPGLSLTLPDTITAVAVAPSNASYVYVATVFSKFFVSSDGGANFVERDNGLPNRFPTKIAVDQMNPQKVVVTFSGFGGMHVFTSANAGISWSDITSNLPDAPANAVAVDSASNIYVGTDIGVFISTDGGSSWLVLGTGFPRVAVFDLAFTAKGRLLAATHGRGAWVVTPPISKNLVITSGETGGSIVSTVSGLITTGTESKLVLVYVTISNGAGQIVSKITDNGPALNYSLVKSATNGKANRIELWDAVSTLNFANRVITATLTAPATATIVVLVYTGFDTANPIHVSANATGSSTVPSALLAPTRNVLLVGGLTFPSSTTFAPGTGYTSLSSKVVGTSGNFVGEMVEEKTGTVIVGPGSYAVNFTLGSRKSWAIVAIGISSLPSTMHDIAIVSVSPSPSSVDSGGTVTITGTLVNNVEIPESNSSIETFVNTTSIAKTIISSLSAGGSKKITILWNTTGFAVGNYILNETATVSPPEIDANPADNTRAGGIVSILEFAMNASPNSLAIPVLSSGSSTVNLASLNGFSGSVSIATSISPSPGGGVVVNSATNRIYVANVNGNTVSVIDGSTDTFVAAIAVGSQPGNGAPGGIGVNPNTNRIFVTNAASGSVSVIDGSSNSVVATVPIGPGLNGLTVNSNTSRIYVANANLNTVSVIDGSTNAVIATVGVGPAPNSPAVNAKTNRIYVGNDLSNTVSVIDGSTNTVMTTIAVGSAPKQAAVNPNTNRVYVANLVDNTVSVIDGSTNTVIATIGVGLGPQGVAVNPNTNRIYVTNFVNNTVSVIDGSTNSVISTVRVVSGPYGVDVNPITNRIYVGSVSNTMSVIDGLTNSIAATFMAPALAVAPSSVFLVAGGTAAVTLTVSTFSPMNLGMYTVVATGRSGSLTHSVTVLMTITPRATTTSVSCIPASVTLSQTTSCTATVADTSLGTAVTPSGIVTFTTSGTGTFTPSASCTLSGTGANATCSVFYTPNVQGTGVHNIGASFSGDSIHSTSLAMTPFALTVTSPAVGGAIVHIDKLALLTPFLVVGLIVLTTATVIFVNLRRRGARTRISRSLP